jgi:hypothetical protein
LMRGLKSMSGRVVTTRRFGGSQAMAWSGEIDMVVHDYHPWRHCHT